MPESSMSKRQKPTLKVNHGDDPPPILKPESKQPPVGFFQKSSEMLDVPTLLHGENEENNMPNICFDKVSSTLPGTFPEDETSDGLIRRTSSLSFTEPTDLEKSRRGSISTHPSSANLGNISSRVSSVQLQQQLNQQRGRLNVNDLNNSNKTENIGTSGPLNFIAGLRRTPTSPRSATSSRSSSTDPLNRSLSEDACLSNRQLSIKNELKNKTAIKTEPPQIPFTQFFQRTDDNKYHILLGASGSVATIKIPELIDKLIHVFGRDKLSIQLVITNCAEHFLQGLKIPSDIKVWRDQDEWFGYNTNAPVLHVELRKWADLFIIAPISANTLAKLANGIADNLLTSIIRAWNPINPIVIAPAMNTMMYTHPVTKLQLESIKELFTWISVVKPVEKILVCGDIGMGGMATVHEIVMKAKLELKKKQEQQRLQELQQKKEEEAELKFDEEDDDDDSNSDNDDEDSTDNDDESDEDDDEESDDTQALRRILTRTKIQTSKPKINDLPE